MWAYGVMGVEMLLQQHPCESPLPNGSGEKAGDALRLLNAMHEPIGDVSAVEEWDTPRVAQWLTDAGHAGDEMVTQVPNGAALLAFADKTIPEIKKMFSVTTGELRHALSCYA